MLHRNGAKPLEFTPEKHNIQNNLSKINNKVLIEKNSL
jgi:hypothetical protein